MRIQRRKQELIGLRLQLRPGWWGTLSRLLVLQRRFAVAATTIASTLSTATLAAATIAAALSTATLAAAAVAATAAGSAVLAALAALAGVFDDR